jgi:glycosyltransferase involved in cell wall biosynthesis
MKILHIITDLDVGGAEMMLFNLVQEHKKHGQEIQVIGLAGDGLIGNRIKQLGVPVTVLKIKPSLPDPFTIIRLINLIYKINPDVIQTWMYHADLLGAIAAYMAGNPPVIWGLHHTLSSSTRIKPWTKRIIKLNARLSTSLPKKVICCSIETMKSHINEGYAENKMIVIPNGIDLIGFRIDPESRRFIRNEFGLEPETQLIGMMARFHPQKDHHTFILAAEILHKTLPNIHFILAGSNIVYENSKLNNWITAAGMEKYIHLAGLRNDIPRLVAAFDIATLSSAYGEALPVSIGEAMACGVPCVVTDVGDSKEIVSNSGLCVPTRNPKALAEGWEQILSLKIEEKINLGKLARDRIKKEYNITSVAKRYSEVYSMVIPNSPLQKEVTL